MPRISRRNYTLAQLFVFYERLKTDNLDRNSLSGGYINTSQLFDIAVNAFSGVNSEVFQITQSGAVIRGVAERELQKEINLVKHIFNANVTVDFKNTASVKEFIDTLNDCLNLKKVYERNVYLVSHSKGMKSVISFFPTYFLKVWDEEWNRTLSQQVDAAIDGLKDNEVILEAIKKVIAPALENIVPLAIEEMFRAQPELKSMLDAGTENEIKDRKEAYYELIQAIGQVQQNGSLANQISKIYKLDEIVQFLTEEIFKKNNVTKDTKDVKNKFKTNIHQRGGLTLEAIENTVFNMIASGIKGEGISVTSHVYKTGKMETGFKADNIITFGIDPELIQEALETREAVSRERNKELFKRLNENLKNIRDGYIVYSSDKNYTYNKGFEKRGGFKAEGINLDTYRQIMKYTEKNARTFTGAILQTAEGAIAGPSYRHTMEEAMAHDIAYFLFDDFKTIGNEVKAGDVQAIHLMNLNGIYIPLSFFLFAFANAIEEEIGNPDDFVRVEISVPGIEFPTAEDQSRWQQRNKASAYEAWNHQRQIALAKTKIEVHFLKNFKELISQYLG